MECTDGMEAEFDVVASWTRAAVERLGPDHAIPAACRGSASPAALAWLGEACELTPDTVFLDDGAGVGGPAAFAVERFGVRAVLVEPMLQAARAAARLFGLPTLAGSGADLPLASGSIDAAWCLGVLCTTTEKPAMLAELARVLRPGGQVGLLVFIADEPHPAGSPAGNEFPTADGLAELLRAGGLAVVEQVPADDFAEAPLAWTERIERVEKLIESEHGTDPRFATAQDQQSRIGRLLSTGVVRGILLHAVSKGL